MSTAPVSGRRRNRLRTVLVSLASVLVSLLAAALALAWLVGPRFNVWLTPPTPQRYADHVATTLDGGYYATGPQWEQARANLISAGETANSYEELYPTLQAATKAAGGKHSFFRTPSETDTNDAEDTASFRAPAVTTANGISTIVVPPLGTVPADQQQAYAEAGARAIERAAPYTCGWVVDLRGNTGGNMYPMFAALAPLLPGGPAMTFRARDGAETSLHIKDGGAGIGEGGKPMTSTDVRTTIPADQNVAVLYNERVASSGEAVATAFRGLPHARSFGTPTAGYTSANNVIPLPDGSRLILTTGVYVDRTGTNLDEKPIQPDHATSADAAPAAANAWLEAGSCR